MSIPKKYTPFILTALVFSVLAIMACLYGLAQVSDFEWDIKNQQTPHVTSDPDLLNSNVDTSDWVEYKSDAYDYSILLPKEAVLIDEYYGKQVPFDPKGTFFAVKLRDYYGAKNGYSFGDFSFNVLLLDGKSNIINFLEDSFGSGIIKIKVISNNGVDYYKKPLGDFSYDCNLYMVYKSNVVITMPDCSFQDEYFKAILKNIKFK